MPRVSSQSASSSSKSTYRARSSRAAGTTRSAAFSRRRTREFPSPHWPIVWIVHLRDPREAALRQYAAGRFVVRQRVRADDADPGVAEGIGDQRSRGFRRVASALLTGYDAVRDLDDTLGVGWTFERARTDDGVAGDVHEREAVDPDVGDGGRLEARQPCR